MADRTINNFKTQLTAAAAGNVATFIPYTITVPAADAAVLAALTPAPNFSDQVILTIESSAGIEIVGCASANGTTGELSVYRAKEGTQALAHPAGAVVEARVTAGLVGQFDPANLPPQTGYTAVAATTDASQVFPANHGAVRWDRTSWSDVGLAAGAYKSARAGDNVLAPHPRGVLVAQSVPVRTAVVDIAGGARITDVAAVPVSAVSTVDVYYALDVNGVLYKCADNPYFSTSWSVVAGPANQTVVAVAGASIGGTTPAARVVVVCASGNLYASDDGAGTWALVGSITGAAPFGAIWSGAEFLVWSDSAAASGTAGSVLQAAAAPAGAIRSMCVIGGSYVYSVAGTGDVHTAGAGLSAGSVAHNFAGVTDLHIASDGASLFALTDVGTTGGTLPELWMASAAAGPWTLQGEALVPGGGFVTPVTTSLLIGSGSLWWETNDLTPGNALRPLAGMVWGNAPTVPAGERGEWEIIRHDQAGAVASGDPVFWLMPSAGAGPLLTTTLPDRVRRRLLSYDDGVTWVLG